LKAPDSKSGISERVSGVRIPSSPYFCPISLYRQSYEHRGFEPLLVREHEPNNGANLSLLESREIPSSPYFCPISLYRQSYEHRGFEPLLV
jgi:hypothetical protein